MKPRAAARSAAPQRRARCRRRAARTRPRCRGRASAGRWPTTPRSASTRGEAPRPGVRRRRCVPGLGRVVGDQVDVEARRPAEQAARARRRARVRVVDAVEQQVLDEDPAAGGLRGSRGRRPSAWPAGSASVDRHQLGPQRVVGRVQRERELAPAAARRPAARCPGSSRPWRSRSGARPARSPRGR